jgi:hypothetical protein
MGKIAIERSIWIAAPRERVWQAVTEAGFESLSEDARKERLDQDGKGWEMVLENLEAYLGGRSFPF